MCEPKEPSHFVAPDQLKTLFPWAWRQGYWKSEARYLELFRTAGAATILGEASVFYTHMPSASGVAERISRFNPDARLIYVMRDPIERTISHYWHNVMHFGEHRSLSDAIIRDPRYTDVSDYAMQLDSYFAFFDREQIKVLTFEELIEHPDRTVNSIFTWLKLDGFAAASSFQPQNVTPETISGSIWLWRRLRRRPGPLRDAIDRLPASVRRFGARLVTREVSPASVDRSGIVEYLRPLQQRRTEALTNLIGRDFPEWTTLYPPARGCTR
jgi:hypothetical protein